jgi:hypothetical protein
MEFPVHTLKELAAMKHAMVAGALLVVGAARAAVVTITPAAYDFGKTAAPNGVAMHRFTMSSAVGDDLDISITGPNAAEFGIWENGTQSGTYTTYCIDTNGNRSASCPLDVDFRPSSRGIKTATLMVANRRGERATATLRGEGVAPECEMKVVFCNYAHLYTGTFRWTSNLSGAGSQSSEQVQVDVIRGAATCNGSATSSDGGRSLTGAITGSGLVAVEFERGDTAGLFYRITVACPTPDWPATDDAAAVPSQPAEMGHNDRSTYEQAATAVSQLGLKGSSSYPAPETDAVNGVTGAVSISWSLCINPVYVRTAPSCP